MSIIKPKFIAVDSSILGEWAKDTYSDNSERRENASRVLKQISQEGWIILITWHHFEELLRYPDDIVVEKRVRFLSDLPQLAWIWRADGFDCIGSVADILAAEIKTYISQTSSVITKSFFFDVRNCFLHFGRFSDIKTLSDWRGLRPAMVALGNLEQNIASVRHITPNDNENIPLSALRNKALLTEEEQKYAYRNETLDVKNGLAIQGDKRLRDHDVIAKNFCDGIFSNIIGISQSEKVLDKAFIEHFGFNPEELPENITLGEFIDMAVYRKHLEAAARLLKIEFNSIWPRLKECRLPSEEIMNEIRKFRRKASKVSEGGIGVLRASGSDLNDDYIASLLPYLDAIVVDKRIYEYLRQAMKQNPQLSKSMAIIAKVSSYQHLPHALQLE